MATLSNFCGVSFLATAFKFGSRIVNKSWKRPVENEARSIITGGAVGGQKWHGTLGQKCQKCNIPRKHVFYTFQTSLIIFRNFGFSILFYPLDFEIFGASVKLRYYRYFEHSPEERV